MDFLIRDEGSVDLGDKPGKKEGNIGFTSYHIIHAGEVSLIYISCLFTSIIAHDTVALRTYDLSG